MLLSKKITDYILTSECGAPAADDLTLFTFSAEIEDWVKSIVVRAVSSDNSQPDVSEELLMQDLEGGGNPVVLGGTLSVDNLKLVLLDS